MYAESDIAVIVPIYRRELSCFEKISFDRIKKVLKKYNIFVVAPENIELFDKEITLVHFPNENFESVNTYSKMLMSEKFYERFNEYEYIFIYQLDAYIFRDVLLEFANLDYDYIGAPWDYGIIDETNLNRVCYVGNGGVSIRRTKACIDALQNNVFKRDYYYGLNEDIFFSSCENIKIAPIEVARKFALETEVRKNYELNNYKLPFACHAWEKYDYSFWKPIIESDGYKIDKKMIRTGNEDFDNREYYYDNRVIAENVSSSELYRIVAEKQKDRGLYLWGAGYYGRIIKKYFNERDMIVCAFVDLDEMKQGKEYEGIPVISPEELPKEGLLIITVKRRFLQSVHEMIKKEAICNEIVELSYI